jgi:uncharacterized protein
MMGNFRGRYLAAKLFLQKESNWFNTIGRGIMEDPVAMLRKYPVVNDYWQDKRADISKIQVPAYILASYSTMLHLPGSLRGYEEILHDKKW